MLGSSLASCDQPPPAQAAEQTEELPQSAPPPAPPMPSSRVWGAPRIGADAPTIGLLPGEDPEASRSIGDVSSGWLVHAHQLHFPHPHLAILQTQAERHLAYTTDEMAALLDAGAARVAARFPGAITYLGNLGDVGGGDIPWSVSHNSGRDADVAFFVTDPEGQPAEMPDLLPLDEQGRYEGDAGTFIFDVPKNWALIEGFLEHDGTQLQYIFVADWLRDDLLDHARDIGADRDTIELASKLMRQPRATLPHNDHFHLRIYCSARDIRSGCINSGRIQPGFDAHRDAYRAALDAARAALDHDDAEVRAAGLERILLLYRADGWRLGRDLRAMTQLVSEDPSALVRVRAAHVLGELGRGSDVLTAQLGKEEHPRVVAEIITALGLIKDDAATAALIAQLQSPRPITLGEDAVDARILIADALGGTEDARPVGPLIELLVQLEDDAGALRQRVATALGRLTNQRFLMQWEEAAPALTRVAAQQWQQWWKEHGEEPREDWLVAGFRDAGFEVEGLGARHVWDICRAIEGDEHISYNAQRVLMRMSGNEPMSLTWPKADAFFYWRRWFERRRWRFGAPPIPEELSTLD